MDKYKMTLIDVIYFHFFKFKLKKLNYNNFVIFLNLNYSK